MIKIGFKIWVLFHHSIIWMTLTLFKCCESCSVFIKNKNTIFKAQVDIINVLVTSVYPDC